jgi:DNA mismatch endonuclease (patch repair protein)
VEFWAGKMDRNRTRDKVVIANLNAMGWEAIVIWQCELKDIDETTYILKKFLGSPRN